MACYPIATITICIVVCTAFGVGMKDFEQTNDAEKLWVPASSRIQEETRWVKKNFPPITRYAMIIFSSSNMLSPEALGAVSKFNSDHLISVLVLHLGHQYIFKLLVIEVRLADRGEKIRKVDILVALSLAQWI